MGALLKNQMQMKLKSCANNSMVYEAFCQRFCGNKLYFPKVQSPCSIKVLRFSEKIWLTQSEQWRMIIMLVISQCVLRAVRGGGRKMYLDSDFFFDIFFIY